ncbi:hypothetical protein CL689_02035 [Candidatus Saccharibacteria bacterium]|nr:hypothetical protein [Candidatus Saccharibacteria bacterium]MBQ68819.1 hypothetical protein [Candidatus Saccharibacteria bacterium]|tara:strand:+ start:1133 stop:1744 length:612 start_codon:yes stop_codon:yes gene_type:complete
MSQYRHERPRERIAADAAVTLTDHELLQAIIGSGTKGADVRVIARRILKLLKQQRRAPSYETLRAIDGVGVAKAAVIVASFELAGRYLHRLPRRRSLDTKAPTVKPGMLYCRFIQRSGALSDDSWLPEGLSADAIVRRIMVSALRANATSLEVYDGFTVDDSMKKLTLLERRQRLQLAVSVLGITLVSYQSITNDVGQKTHGR